MKYDPEIHNRQSVRLKEYDYSQDGTYFVTICTRDKECFFGKIKNGKMFLNDVGEMARKYWLKIEELHDFVKLGSFVIMPNHVHGIIIFDKTVGASIYGALKHQVFINGNQGAMNRAPTRMGGFAGAKNPMLKISLGTIIRWYKGRCTFEINKKQSSFFGWQRNYHEHIVRNEESFEKINNYIIRNPLLWEKDGFFVK